MLTQNKSQVEISKIVIFGAGKIGRSFIGQLFGCSGYKVVFIDVDPVMITRLNQQGNYRVVIKGEKDEEIIVPNVKAISALDKDKVVDAVSTAGILAVSVGKNALEKVIPAIAAGLVQRFTNNPGIPLDIILAENMRSSAYFVRTLLKKNLPSGFPVQINAVNMEPERLKKEFGSEVTFWGGGCNTQSTLNRATPQLVKDHVRHNLEIFSAGGGYVFNSIHNIMPDVPPENIMAMFEAVQEFH